MSPRIPLFSLGIALWTGCADTVSQSVTPTQDVPPVTDSTAPDVTRPLDVVAPLDTIVRPDTPTPDVVAPDVVAPDVVTPGGICRTGADCLGGLRCVYTAGCATGVTGHCTNTAGCESLPVAPQYCGCDGVTFTIPSACPPERLFEHNGRCEGADAGADASVSPYAGAILAWQAPGGFAGTGPAIVVRGDGTIQTWTTTSGFDALTTTPTGGTTTHVMTLDSDTLFARWSRVALTGLPHGTGTSAECYPTVTVRLCPTCAVTRMNYNSADQLLPEMRAVFDWFASHAPATNPESFCRFF